MTRWTPPLDTADQPCGVHAWHRGRLVPRLQPEASHRRQPREGEGGIITDHRAPAREALPRTCVVILIFGQRSEHNGGWEWGGGGQAWAFLSCSDESVAKLVDRAELPRRAK